MEQKVLAFANRGMRQDVSISKASNEFAFENHNIRITARGKDTFLSVTNEKGNKEIKNVSYKGNILGHCILGKYLILFTKDNSSDYIERCEFINDTLKITTLVSGDLNFDSNYPIETLGHYESELIQKVYWVDGINPPRVLNILEENADATKLDFVVSYSKNTKVNITKEFLGGGSFPSGTIQYICTYYNKHGQETNSFYTSPLFYIADKNKGSAPDESVNCSFKLEFDNVDSSFDYIRIYSIIRTSLNATPQAYIVADIKTHNKITLIDTGTIGSSIDPSLLLYLNKDEFSASTIAQKDNTLFLGDINKIDTDYKELKDLINTYNKEGILIGGKCNPKYVTFEYTAPEESLDYVKPEGIFPYESSLNYSSFKIKSFKGGNTYRLAIQLETNKGHLSDAIWIGDIKNPLYPKIQNGKILVPKIKVILPEAVENKIKSYPNIDRVRLLMAETFSSDREVVAQGFISPTMFNIQDRCNNKPYSISSWITRPFNSGIPHNHFSSLLKNTDINAEIQNVTDPQPPYYIKDSAKAITNMTLEYWVEEGFVSGFWRIGYVLNIEYSNGETIPITYTDQPWELGNREKKYNDFYTHISDYLIDDDIPTFEHINGLVDELLQYPDINKITRGGLSVGANSIHRSAEHLHMLDNRNSFYVDTSIVTFHSPELESNEGIIDNADLKFRIIGTARLTSNNSSYTINIKGNALSVNAKTPVINFNNNNISTEEGLVSFPLWMDSLWFKNKDDNYEKGIEEGLYHIYMWHKQGSLNGQPKKNIVEEYASSLTSELKSKLFTNVKYSYITDYYTTSDSKVLWEPPKGIDTVKVFNSNNMEVINVKGKSYFGNVDRLLTPFIPSNKEKADSDFGVVSYPIVISKDAHSSDYNEIRSKGLKALDYNSIDPIRIKYKSPAHAVVAFNQIDDINVILPYFYESDKFIFSTNVDSIKYPWEKGTYNPAIIQDKIEINNNSYFNNCPYVYVAELYRDSENCAFGNKTKESAELNTYIPIGEFYNTENLKQGIYGVEGDTYFQRWDCLKTKPFAEGDENSVTEVISLMLETYSNIDGRYDTNREHLDIINTNSINTINSSYSQPNNMFSYFNLDEKFDNLNLRNQFLWSKTKINTEDIDTWSGISEASSLLVDGSKGPITKILNNNDRLLLFQPKRISEILFNSRTQISTSDGVPIELANSGKVDSVRVLLDDVGCNNKWSIVSSTNTVYYIDDYNKSINTIGETTQSLSLQKGFANWIKSVSNLSVWAPERFDNFISFKDIVNNDIYFVNKEHCLVYSEILGEFTSFMDYNRVPLMVNIDGKFISLKNNKIWLQNEGQYNNFFGNTKPYFVKYKVTPNPYGDKVFTNIEFRADFWNYETLTNNTFDRLEAINEYQKGESQLKFNKYALSNIKKKFRIWRADIPRDSKNKLDRIRNPWVILSLYKDTPQYERMEFHDLIVKYFE